MTFEQAMAQMRVGKRVTRPKYKGYIRFGIGIDDRDDRHEHQSPWQNRRIVKFVKMSKPDEKVRWRAFIVSHISAHDVLAEDWEICDG